MESPLNIFSSPATQAPLMVFIQVSGLKTISRLMTSPIFFLFFPDFHPGPLLDPSLVCLPASRICSFGWVMGFSRVAGMPNL